MIPRLHKILAHIDLRQARGVEIGPLTSPVITRDMADITYIDRASKEELARWFSSHSEAGIDTTHIVEIDHVWGDRTLAECVGPGVAFDFCVACHVMEHVPDLVTWLQEVNSILKEDGILTLALPDKRYTFDCLRSLTVVSDVVDAYVSKLRKPSARHIYDHFSLHVKVDAQRLWQESPEALDLQPNGDDRNLLRICEEAVAGGTYIDSHCWVITPRSFLDLLADLSKIGLIDFEVAGFFPTEVGELEFFVSLRKLPPRLSAQEKAARQRASIARAIATDTAHADARRARAEAAEDERDAAMAETRARLSAAETELAIVKASKSWRLTAPLRAVSRVLQHFIWKQG